MKNIVSINKSKTFLPQITLERIWYIEGEKDFYRAFRTSMQNMAEAKKDEDTMVALFTMEGVGLLMLDDKEFVLKANSLIIFFINQKRIYKSYGDDWKFYWYEFKYPKYSFKLNTIYEYSLYDYEKTYFEFTFNNLSDRDYCDYCASLFQSLLLHTTFNTDKSDSNNITLKVAIDYLNDNYDNCELRISKVAEVCNITERQLRNIFVKYIHMSPIEYLNNYRLVQAMELLTLSHYSIKEIANFTGYSNQYYFSKAFKNKYGGCPLKYR